MKIVLGVSSLLAIAQAAAATAATPAGHEATQARHSIPRTPGLPSKYCSMRGGWTNDYGYDMTLHGNRGKTGSITRTGCSGSYAASVSNLTKTGWDLTATYAGGTDCVSFTETMTWNGSCSSASGTYTTGGGQTGPDGWTQNADIRTRPAHAELSTGLK